MCDLNIDVCPAIITSLVSIFITDFLTPLLATCSAPGSEYMHHETNWCLRFLKLHDGNLLTAPACHGLLAGQENDCMIAFLSPPPACQI